MRSSLLSCYLSLPDGRQTESRCLHWSMTERHWDILTQNFSWAPVPEEAWEGVLAPQLPSAVGLPAEGEAQSLERACAPLFSL